MLKNNQLLHAMIIPAAVGTVFYTIRSAVSYLFRAHISPHLYSYVVIHSVESEYFEVVFDFIRAHRLREENHIVASKPKILDVDANHYFHDVMLPNIHYQPIDSGCVVSIQYKGRTVYVCKQADETAAARGSELSFVKREKILLYVLGKDPAILKTLISDSIVQANKVKTGCMRIFSPCTYYEKWTIGMCKKLRLSESLVLDKTLLRDIVDDAKTFIKSRQWYENMNIPFRRGYLFHGPPGCGKTSLCHVLAGALELDICVLSLSNRFTNDNNLSKLLRDAPLRSLVILEDVDAIFTHRTMNSGMPGSGVTFSGLLNAIDGVGSREGVLFVMTTNHIDRLDPALIRPGRCDMKVRINNASREQMITMFLRFFPGCDDDARCFASSLPVNELSLAQIQNHLVGYKHSMEEAVAAAAELVVSKE